MTRVLQSPRLRGWVGAAVVALLALTVAWPHAALRRAMRAQILAREGRTLLALVDLQRTLEIDRLRERRIPAEALDELLVALQTTRLAGVAALRLEQNFGGVTEQVTLPAGVREAPLAREDTATAARREPVVRFHAQFDWLSLFDATPAGHGDAACVEIIVPVSAPDDPPVIAQYWIEGDVLAAEFATLDRRLLAQATLVWATASAVALGLLGWTARRIAVSADALARTNRELALAAKTSALGAVAAHLMHGLRNPISGLRGLARDRVSETVSPAAGEAWSEAAQLAERLHGMVDEVTQLLRDDTAGVAYALTAPEFEELLRKRVAPHLARGRATLVCEFSPGLELDSRRAGLLALVLANLVQNAVEASPDGASVDATWRRDAGRDVFEVADRGPGLPAEVRARLFLPVTSGRPQGAGIGLAISRQLAAHAGGELTLVRSDTRGTVFRVELPGAGEQGRV